MCTIGIKPEPVKNVVGFVNVPEVFILAASSISLQKSLWNSLEPCTFSRNTHPAIWCLTKLEYNGMSFNLIIANKSVPNIPPLFKYRKN